MHVQRASNVGQFQLLLLPASPDWPARINGLSARGCRFTESISCGNYSQEALLDRRWTIFFFFFFFTLCFPNLRLYYPLIVSCFACSTQFGAGADVISAQVIHLRVNNDNTLWLLVLAGAFARTFAFS